MATVQIPGLERRLRRDVEGDVLFAAFDRGRYSTDASIYQIMPVGVVIPRSADDLDRAIQAAISEGVAVLPRGGGTSQNGQTVNEALVIDCSRHVNRLLELDVENRRCVVEPGIVLDELNRQLKPHGLWFPVDVSTASRATIGGMCGNNSCGGRSIRYGMMRDNVLSIDAVMADGTERHFGAASMDDLLARELLALGEHEADEIASRFPKVQRRVGGYNIDALVPGASNNLAHLLVGSEGTLAFSKRIELKLSPLPKNKVMGVCHFPTFHDAMEAAQHLVTLGPSAVELVDRTMIELAREIPLFQETMKQFIRGEPGSVLLVEFSDDDSARNIKSLADLADKMNQLGFDWGHDEGRRGGVVEAIEPAFQTAITEVRKSGLNIMMSMRTEGKPVSFVEDCAVELKDLAAYTSQLTDVFHRHGTTGTWYAHASVGCLHVRPVLNLRREEDVKKMRAIAEEAMALVRKYKGSHSGEHGDGLSRSEFNEVMFGPRMMGSFRHVKRLFDPNNLFNPGKIVDAPKMDDRSLFRYKPDYAFEDRKTALDWSDWTGRSGGFQGAIEMCNNNGACRKRAGGAMCPSYRVTGNERDVTRGRANTLRLALSGQLGPDAFASDEMAEAMKLCVGCKACKRECPTGVDMARMKIEVMAARAKKHGVSLQDRLIGYLPRYAPYASKMPSVANLRNSVSGLAGISEKLTGFSAKRKLPHWRADVFRDPVPSKASADVVLFADTFNRYFEPENLSSALKVLEHGGRTVEVARPADGGRPLCCGRTFLSVGMVEEARREARRTLKALKPALDKGLPIVALEPSCLSSLIDEIPALMPVEETSRLAELARSFEAYLSTQPPLQGLKAPVGQIHLHGHCHQKAHDQMSAVEEVLQQLPDAKVSRIESSCCGMAGAFGYAAQTHDISLKMAELSLLPAVRKAGDDAIIVADGTSCRHQISDGTSARPVHVVRLLAGLLPGASGDQP